MLLATNTVPKGQALYHGFVKPREAHHDADLYRLYQHGLDRIAREGGKNPRVILDFELKKDLYRELAASRPVRERELRAEIAERHGLTVVGGSIPVPDLRIEYETRDDQPAHLDLELATGALPLPKPGPKSASGIFDVRAAPGCLEPASCPRPARTYCGDFEPVNVPQDHVARLMDFGYTEAEARFLYIVATHSGYFTLRQYLQFTGRTGGMILRPGAEIVE